MAQVAPKNLLVTEMFLRDGASFSFAFVLANTEPRCASVSCIQAASSRRLTVCEQRPVVYWIPSPPLPPACSFIPAHYLAAFHLGRMARISRALTLRQVITLLRPRGSIISHVAGAVDTHVPARGIELLRGQFQR